MTSSSSLDLEANRDSSKTATAYAHLTHASSTKNIINSNTRNNKQKYFGSDNSNNNAVSNNNNTDQDSIPADDDLLSDIEEHDEFVKKYGDINFRYISKPKNSFWFIKPHALNYFKDGVLYRTKGERTSGKTELFLDLLYVGIVANLAGDATEHASASSFLKYVLLFIPTWTVWADIKDFMNYYYTEDLSQKLYLLWILVLLVIYDNNCIHVLESREAAALTVVPYILCRVSLAVSLVVYSLWIPEHRVQMRAHAISIFVCVCVYIPIIFILTRAKIGVAFAAMFLENVCFSIIYHPWFKQKLNLTTGTALNIEHEVERFGAFFIIAIGEFLYKTVAEDPIGAGLHSKLGRGVCCLIISYTFLWLYFNGGTSVRATHPLRRKGETAILWIYGHLPLIAGLILAADSAGEWIQSDDESTKKHAEGEDKFSEQSKTSSVTSPSVGAETEEHEPSRYALSFFFTGGICVSFLSLCMMGFLEKSRDSKNMHIVPKFYRIIPRAIAGIIILCLSFAELQTSELLGLTTMICVVVLFWESVTMTPKTNLPRYFGGCHKLKLSEEIEWF